MRILVLSDLHLGGPRDAIGRKRIAEAQETEADVLLFCGDLANTEAAFADGLEGLLKIRAAHRLFVAGNHDLNGTGPVSQYAAELQAMLGGAFHLLDDHPVDIKGIRFAGNMLGYDGSLYRGSMPFGEVAARAANGWRNGISEARRDISAEDLSRQLQERLLRDAVGECIVCTHTVPSSEFLLYGKSEKFDLYNYGMGVDLSTRYPSGALFGLCGHTHRDATVQVNGVTVHNISEMGQLRIFEL